jgi:SAM-dependent methyltransferase
LKSKWFETFFQGASAEFWTRIMTPAFTIPEVDLLARTLDVGPHSHILDVACGNGRHAIELARRGCKVTGVDLSDEFLARARAGSAGVDGLEWVKSDMRNLQISGPFDGAYCFGNSFGYLDYTGVRALFGALARALKPGAKLVLDTGVMAESILPALQPRGWYRAGDIVMLSERRYVAEGSRLDIDYTFIVSGNTETHATSSYVLTVAELTRLLDSAGFRVVSLNGGMTGEPFQLGSPRLILTAQLDGEPIRRIAD